MAQLVNKRQLVFPGDVLAEGNYIAGKNTYREQNRIYSSQIGFTDLIGKNIQVIALKGCYVPTIGDLVIGKIIDMRLNGWIVDINSPYMAMLFTSDVLGRSFNLRRDNMSDYLDIGDLVKAKVTTFDRTRDPVLTMKESGLGKVTQGHVTKINTTKIPRVIGKKGSMINLLKQGTGCDISIGQNGLALVSGKNPDLEALTIQAIHIIERDAHTDGLTDKISELIIKEKERMESNVKG